MRIGIKQPGLYRLKASEIAAALGVSSASVRTLIAHNGLRMTTAGKTVATLQSADHATMYIYGKALDTIYSGTNVYWLAPGTARP